MFNTQDRVHLWNKLVFTEGYFRRLANNTKFERGDLKIFYDENVEKNVNRDEAELIK